MKIYLVLNYSYSGNRNDTQKSPITVEARETSEETGFLLSTSTMMATQQTKIKTVTWLPDIFF